MQSRRYVTPLRFRRCILQQRVNFAHCLFSTSTTFPPEPETAIVPCGNNGSITLDIFRPLNSPSFINTSVPSVLLYLPRGQIFGSKPSHASLADERVIPATLAQTSGVTVVQVNYRLDPANRFPTPIHDVLTGYDWVVENLEHASQASKESSLRMKQIPIGVCGELVGGTLSLSLALTECKLLALPPASRSSLQRSADADAGVDGGEAGKGRVVAVAANNPIVDWVLPFSKDLVTNTAVKTKISRNKIMKKSTEKNPGLIDELAIDSTEKSTSEHQNELLDVETLVSARSSFFHPGRLVDRFDPFASPVLFLRTPGVVIQDSRATSDGLLQGTKSDQVEIEIFDEDEDVYDDKDSDLSASLSKSPISERSQSSNLSLNANRVVNETADDIVVIPWLDDAAPTTSPSDTPTGSGTSKAKRPYKPRKLPRKYPPASMLPVSFPLVRLSAGEASPLKHQSIEMTNLLRRALGRHEFPGHYTSNTASKTAWDHGNSSSEGQEILGVSSQPSSEDMKQYVNQRIEFHLRGVGSGLWCSSHGNERVDQNRWDEEEIHRVGKWFGVMLRA